MTSPAMKQWPVKMAKHAVKPKRAVGPAVLYQRYNIKSPFKCTERHPVRRYGCVNGFPCVRSCHSQAVCCDDLIHCCPKGKMCNLVSMTCDDDEGSEPLVGKVPAVPRQGVQVGEVPCDKTASCPDGTTCCKNKMDLWSCCPLPEVTTRSNKHTEYF